MFAIAVAIGNRLFLEFNASPRGISTPRTDPPCFMKRAPFSAFPALLLAAAILTAGCGHAQPDSALLTLEKEIALPGVEGRIDHFSVDV